MKLSRIVALVTLFFSGMALAGMEQLAAELPSCGVSHRATIALLLRD